MKHSLRWFILFVIIAGILLLIIAWLLRPFPLQVQLIPPAVAALDVGAANHVQLGNLYLQQGMMDEAITEYHLVTQSKVESIRTAAFAGLEVASSGHPLQLVHQKGQKFLFDLIGFAGPVLLLLGLGGLCYAVIKLMPPRNHLLIFPFDDYSDDKLGQAVAESIQQSILLAIAVHQRQNNSLLAPAENFELPTVGLWSEATVGDAAGLTSLIVNTSDIPLNSLLNQAAKWWHNRQPHVRGTIRKQGDVYYLSARLLGRNKSAVSQSIFQVQASPDERGMINLLKAERDLAFQIMHTMDQDLEAASWRSFAFVTEAMWALDSLSDDTSKLSNPHPATQLLEQAIVVDPNYQLAKYLLGTMYLQTGALTESRRLLKEVVENSLTYKWAATYNLGVSFFQEFEEWAYEYACRYFDQLVNISDSSSRASRFQPLGHCGLASIYAQMVKRVQQDERNKYFQKVMNHYRLAMQGAGVLSPADAGLVRAITLTAKGLALYQQESLSEAIETFNEAIDRRGNYALPYIYLSNISLEAEQFDEAELYIEQALRYNPSSTYLHYRLGRVYESWSKLDLSEQAYFQAHDISNAQNRLGWLMVQQKRYKEAVTAFKQTITLNSKHADGMINLASCYLWLEGTTEEDLVEAVNLAKKSLSLSGGNRWYKHLILGQLYEKQGKLDKSLEQLERAVELNDTCAQCRFYLAELLKDLGNMSEAKQHLAKFFKLPDRDQWEEDARNLMHVLAK